MKAASLMSLLLVILVITPAAGQDMTGRQIMEEVDTRLVPDDSQMQTTMILTNKRGQTRERKLKTFRFSDTKQIMWFLEPADVKGSSFLRYTHDDRDEDMWLYLPSFGKIRRIASHAKKGSFMGSDFTYEDMGDRKVNDYEYKLLNEEMLDGKKCWVVESIPKKGVTTDYSKIVSWVWETDFFTVKEEFYDKRGNLKKVKHAEPVQMEKYWMISSMSMENLKSKSKTDIIIENIEVNTGLEEKVFDQRYMKRIY